MIVSRPVVPLLVPDLPDRNLLWPYLQRMDESRQYSNFGPLACELEAKLAAALASLSGAPVYVTTVSSATLGLELALTSLNLKPGSRVLVPALTFVATATAVIRAGHVPVIGDIDAATWSMSAHSAAAAFESTPFDAALPVTAFGLAQNCEEWLKFHNRYRVPVLIDAAAAFGGQRICGADTTAVFSLHTTKSLPAGEGGLVASTSAERIRQVRQSSNFGINLDPLRELPAGSSSLSGTNAKLSEYHAAVGLASLARWAERAEVRRALMQRYKATLHDASRGELMWQATAPGAAPVAAPTLLCVRWPGAANADRLEQVCAAHGVMTRRWYQPLLHRHPNTGALVQHLATPVADRLAGELIGLPFFPDMSAEQIERVARCVAQVAAEFAPSMRRSQAKIDSLSLPPARSQAALATASRIDVRTDVDSDAEAVTRSEIPKTQSSPYGHP